MSVRHCDIYTVSTKQGFNGQKSYMNFVCRMTSYAVSEPLQANQMNLSGFAKAIMKIMLTHCSCHTLVVDKDSKF